MNPDLFEGMDLPPLAAGGGLRAAPAPPDDQAHAENNVVPFAPASGD
jgi:hypothetical protein